METLGSGNFFKGVRKGIKQIFIPRLYSPPLWGVVPR